MSTPNAIDWFPPRWLETPPGDLLAAPDVAELLAHLRAEVDRVRANLDHHEARHLEGSVDEAARALEAGDPAVLALRFFLLGMNVQALGRPIRGDDLTELLRAGASEKRRQLPLELRNARAQHVREWAQELGANLWGQPEHQHTRVADMAEHVWAITAEARAACADGFPEKSSGLIPWLREVAPAAARKPGRPARK